jgi:succinate-semialdehyde dehydrogenase/glutarate-semialdehyde dehydrogenase
MEENPMPIATINPATGETIREFPELSDAEIETKLATAASTFRTYRRTSFAERAGWLRRAATLLEENKQRYAEMMTLEMGKPIQQAVAEAEKCAWVCRFYADEAEQILADRPVETDASQSFVRYLPLGPVLAVMPWNFPFWQVLRFAAPALMAGNVGLLKHASNVPQCALAIEELLLEAGFPEGAFQTLLIGSQQVPRVLGDERIQAATLTGSGPAGSAVAEQAGKLIKKTVLELGGSDPFIVMSSADLDDAARTGATARLLNSGQSCIAAKRFIVHDAVAEEFAQRLIARFEELVVGEPSDAQTEVGPLATRGGLDDIERQVQQALDRGATALVGGQRLDRPGYFYAPTILTDLTPAMSVYREEVFGPVLLLFRVQSLDAAIELANDTEFGLGASAWTTDATERERFINELEAGNVFINGLVKSDPRLPFGGVKQSGYGRELSIEGIREFVNIKTVWVK